MDKICQINGFFIQNGEKYDQLSHILDTKDMISIKLMPNIKDKEKIWKE